MNAKMLLLLLLPLAGCSSTSETQHMPVQILTAEPANAQATDMPRVCLLYTSPSPRDS